MNGALSNLDLINPSLHSVSRQHTMKRSIQKVCDTMFRRNDETAQNFEAANAPDNRLVTGCPWRPV